MTSTLVSDEPLLASISSAFERIADRHVIFTSSLLRYLISKRLAGFPATVSLGLLSECLVQMAIQYDKNIFVPAFCDEFVQCGRFCPDTSISKSGSLPNYLIKNGLGSKWNRTFHPIVSYVVTGPNSVELSKKKYPNAFGGNSVFDLLVEQGVGHLCFDIDAESGFTLLHRAEEEFGVNYRFLKDFSGKHIVDGVGLDVTVQMYVRKDTSRKFKFSEGFFSNPEVYVSHKDENFSYSLNYYSYGCFRERIKNCLVLN